MKEKIVIGRSDSADIVINDASISARHLEISLLDRESVMLSDLSSTNGTWLIYNGKKKRIKEGKVPIDSEVLIGKVKVNIRSIIKKAPSRKKLRREIKPLSEMDFKRLKHYTEISRLILALLVTVPFALGLGFLLFFALFSAYNFGFAIAPKILITSLVSIFFLWFSIQIMKARFIGNAVRVSEYNFKEIHDILNSVKRSLNYPEDIEVYIVEEGEYNALLKLFWRDKVIVLHTELVETLYVSKSSNELSDAGYSQITWIIARFVGALRSKQAQISVFIAFMSILQKFQIMNLLVLPYERATQYTGDQIGLAICGDLENTIAAYHKFFVGSSLYNRVQPRGLVQQANQLNYNFFGFISRIISTHPHNTDRYLNLLAFAKANYPDEFKRYVNQLDELTYEDIAALLPNYRH